MKGMQNNVEFGYQIRTCSITKKATENLDKFGPSQGLSDAYWTLASSPALLI
jgi:hypothetical protein